MKKVTSLMIAMYIVMAYSSWGLELSGFVLDEKMAPRRDAKVLLGKQLLQGEAETLTIDTPVEGTTWMSTTDRAGRFIFTNLTSGSYMLSVILDSFEGGEKREGTGYYVSTVELSSGSITNIVLAPSAVASYDLQMQFRNIETGLPFMAEIEIMPILKEKALSPDLSNLGFMEKSKTDEQGRVYKQDIPEGDYSIWISILGLSELASMRIPLEFKVGHDGAVLVDELYNSYVKEKGIDVIINTSR